MDLNLSEAIFRVMGSACRITADVDESALHRAVHRIEDLEARWSRFRASSEVSRCNRMAGEWTEVSAITVELFQRARTAHDLTAGRFDPMMLSELEAIGYDRDHLQLETLPSEACRSLAENLREALASVARTAPGGKMKMAERVCRASGGQASERQRLSVEVEGGAVRIPTGSGFDPGGLGKGLAADIVVADLLDVGATWVMVSLGGDIRFGGEHVAEVGCSVGIEDPWSPGEVLLNTTIRTGGLATSSTLTRRWLHEGQNRHHVLDPSTGSPTTGLRVAASVVAEESWWADVLAKCLIVDPELGADELKHLGGSGLAIDVEGQVEHLGLVTHEFVG